MGPFLVEIVYCPVTRRGRKKKKGMNKMGLENTRNDGPAFKFIPPEDTVKITLDLSENGPVFSALDNMMLKLIDDENEARKQKGASDDAKKSLKRLLKSGIPGVEKMFAAPQDPKNPSGPKKPAKGFHKMTDGSKQKFMKAVFGEEGTSIDSSTAAALLAATCSGGDTEIADNIAQILLPELSEKIDPTMMAALMSSSSLINAGASTEEVMKTMKSELSSSGMTEEDILNKTQKLMTVFKREESSNMAEYSLASKQTNVALKKNGTSPKDFSMVVLAQKAITACGTTPENVAKVIMMQNQLAKRGAQSRHIAEAMKHQADFETKKAEVVEKITKAISDDKLKKEDVFNNVRMAQGLENENEPSWKEVRMMKDILQGASPNSPEAIELNLNRATKTAGLKGSDIAAALLSQKVLGALNVDPQTMAQVINVQKTIAENGVPSVEIARVLSDGGLPKELTDELCQQVIAAFEKDFNEHDVDSVVKLYDNLRLKSNIPTEVIDDIDKNLIQVRCSLEDVADNLVASQLARGEKEHMIIRNLCETLFKTGASPEIAATTMMGALRKVLNKTECDILKDTGRTLFEQGVRGDDLTKAMTELVLNLLDENIELREEAAKAMELVLKEAGGFPEQIRELIQEVLPPEPPRPMSPRLAAELERLRLEDEAREAEKARKLELGESDSEGSFDEDEPDSKTQKTKKIKNGKPKNPALDSLKASESKTSLVDVVITSDSRRGSLTPLSRRGSGQRSRCGSISLAGVERRGSFYSDEVSKRSTVAVVIDDPQSKKQMTDALNDVFSGEDHDGQAGENGIHEKNAVGVKSLNGPTAGVSPAKTRKMGQAAVQDEAISATDGSNLTHALASTLGLDLNDLRDLASVQVPDVSPAAMNAIMNAQRNLPPGSANDPQAIMKAILKEQNGSTEISQELIESLLKAQSQLPPSLATSPETAMRALMTAKAESSPEFAQSLIKDPGQLLTDASGNSIINNAMLAQQGRGAQIPPESVQAILKIQSQLSPGQAADPEAVMQAVLKAHGSQSKIPPELVESIIQAQKKLPPGAGVNSEAVLNMVKADRANISNSVNGGPLLEAALKAQAEAAKNVTPAVLEAIIKAQRSLPASASQDPQALLAALAQYGGPTANIPPSVLATVLSAQKCLPAGVDQDPHALLKSVQTLQESLSKGSFENLSPAVLQAVAQSLPGPQRAAALSHLTARASNHSSNAAGLTGLPPQLLNAISKLSPEQIEKLGADGSTDLAERLQANADKLQSLFDSLGESDGNSGQVSTGGSFHLSLKDGKLSEEDVGRLLSVFETSGIVSNIGGISKFRTMRDMKDTVLDSRSAFDTAIQTAKKRSTVGISDENRKLLDEILRERISEQQEINSRVSMLLAGTALTTKVGVKVQRRETVHENPYDMLLAETSSNEKYRRRTVAYNDNEARDAAHAAADRLSALSSQAWSSAISSRPSVKRTSLARLRRLSENSEAKRKEEEERRRITGLRRAKVPLMVYSCGGFTRCFRIARYHVTDGPPIGVTYDEESSRKTPQMNHEDT